MKYKIKALRDYPNLIDASSKWFSDKWGIPKEAYLESMNSMDANHPVPQWYIACDKEKIVGGLGVIENDFHKRKDLTPNICAVYVLESYRKQGIAGELLNYACRDMKQFGIDKLYLLTDHTGFYERYDWEFFCSVQADGEDFLSRMYIKKLI